METKTIQIEIPEYLTIGQYQRLPEGEEESKLKKYLGTISAITGIDEEEIGYWDLESIKKVGSLISNMVDPKNEFHSLLEWNGELLGYSNIKQQTLGQYIDLESLCKDVRGNLHKIAAILYRPVTEHSFDKLSFEAKQTVKMVNNKVENVFDFYDIEIYDSKKRKKRENAMKDFPVHIVLGALSFFLNNATQYLVTIAYSDNPEKVKSMNQKALEDLLESTGAGGGLFTHSLNPIYYQYQGKRQLQTLTS